MRVVYVDVLFMTNLAINYLLLVLTASISGVYTGRLRMLGGAALGALFAVCLYFPQISAPLSLLFKVLLCLSISVVSFNKCRPKALLRISLIFLAVSFAFAGGIMALSLVSGSGALTVSNGVPYIGITLKFLLVATIIVYCLLGLVFRPGMAAITRKNAEIEVFYAGSTAKLRGFTDSGNLARDPITGKRIIILSQSAARQLLGRDESDLISRMNQENILETYTKLTEIKAGSFRLVPFKTVASRGGMVIALKPDKICVDGKPEPGFLIGIIPSELPIADGSQAIIGV